MTTMITSLEQLHAVELEALCEIDRVCQLHGIRWFLHGGTLLGSLRHAGPIPWDDDLDIAMLADDYARFKKLALPDLSPRFSFTDHAQDEEFFDFVPRITDLAYEYPVSDELARRFELRTEHPGVDIFVFCPALQGKADALQSLRLTINYAKAMGHRANVDHNEFNGVAKLASYVLPALGKRTSIGKLLAQREKLAHQAKADAPTLRIVNDLPAYMDRRYERTWYEGERRTPFMGVDLPIPAGAEHEMGVVYGPTWRELPPLDKRVPAHAGLPYEPREASAEGGA